MDKTTILFTDFFEIAQTAYDKILEILRDKYNIDIYDGLEKSPETDKRVRLLTHIQNLLYRVQKMNIYNTNYETLPYQTEKEKEIFLDINNIIIKYFGVGLNYEESIYLILYLRLLIK